MKFIVIMLTLSGFMHSSFAISGKSAAPALNSQCLKNIAEYSAERALLAKQLDQQKLSLEKYHSLDQDLLLNADLRGNECAEDYPEEQREAVKQEFMKRFHKSKQSVASANISK